MKNLDVGINALWNRDKEIEQALCLDFARENKNVGTWLSEVPCGYKAYERTYNKKISKSTWLINKSIDAICVLEEFDKMIKFKPKHWKKAYISKDGLYNSLNEKDTMIVEAKKKANFKAIGQLMVYEKLMQQDWNCRVVTKVLICAEADYTIKDTAESLDIKLCIGKEAHSNYYKFCEEQMQQVINY